MLAKFRFAPDILRRLGEELNPSLEHGVMELVKNAHDADAHNCKVRLIRVSEAGGSIHVRDDGEGMTASDIVDHFLLLGRSAKVERGRTPRGRVLAGSKGLGRLAALRAGESATITTRPRSEPGLQHRIVLNWSAFDAADAVDDVELEIKTSPCKESATPGTDIRIHFLTSRVGRREVKKLARALLLLADPFDDDPSDFRTSLDSSEFRDLEELVRKKYFDDAEYSLHVEVSADGRAQARVTDWKGETLFTASHQDLRKDGKPYCCPPSQFDLWVFILNAETFQTRKSSVGDVREWLSELGGVMLYVDGIRVPPYGDPGNDWLDMNLRRSQSPEERPSTNTSLGRIRVSDSMKSLTEKTDRSGMIETGAFADLRRMAQDGLEWMARQRLRAAEQRRQAKRHIAPAETSKSRVDVEQAIERIIPEAPAASAPKEAFGQYTAAQEREMQAMREEVQLYRTLSTAGITAATFAHESSGGPLKVIGRAVSTLRRKLGAQFSPMPPDLAKPIDRIGSGVASLEAFSDSTLSLVDKDKRRAGRVEIHQVVKSATETYRPFMAALDAELELQMCDASPYLRGSVAAIESVVVNLLANALTAVSKSTAADRVVRLATEVSTSRLLLSVTDNGSGIEVYSTSEIWLPGVTTRPGGSGLGLTIVKDTVIDLGGSVAASAHGELGGAEFTVSFPLIGS